MPDFVPRAAIAELERKCAVLPPPIDVSAYRHPDLLPHREGAVASDQMRQDQRPPILLWCHRWEYDKNPEPFFRAVLPLDEDHVAFRLVLLGEQFNSAPTVFADAWPRLSKHVLHAGYIESRDEYLAMLRRCDIVVSSAIQENCGIAVIEAMMCGCQPLLPNRLSYPELIPEAHRSICLYNHDEDLLPALRDALRGERRLVSDQRRNLIEFLNRRLGLPDAVTRIDDALSALASETSAPTCRA
jgi:glycosyltransferase involved in cell wall biosynthesis